MSNWQEEFNKKFCSKTSEPKYSVWNAAALAYPEEIKSFIENLLEQERKRLAKRIIKDDVTCPEAYGFEGRDTFSACEKCVVCELRSIINK